ncbi:hypothetical protein [Pseudaminobacter sp. NGMCC 1.201702]|uniref:hypothetical protein n=1 Tax=Pseudaminobacter sp. NGMCC 1.201702 TaxID=3391825 RepID=UPI0039F10244
MAGELLAQEISDSILETGEVGAGTCRDYQMHDVPALAAVQLVSPVSLDKFACIFPRTDHAAGFVANLPVKSLHEVTHARRREAHAIGIAMESETCRYTLSEFAVLEPLLDNFSRFAVSCQPLARTVAQHDDATHSKFVALPLIDSEDEAAIAESHPQDLTNNRITVSTLD